MVNLTNFIALVKQIEGFDIEVCDQDNARINGNTHVRPFDRVNAAAGNNTINEWLNNRAMPALGDLGRVRVRVLNGNGAALNAGTLLRNVRDSY